MFRRSLFALVALLLTTFALPTLAADQDFRVDIQAYDRQPTLRVGYVVQANWDRLAEGETVVLDFDAPDGSIVMVNRYNPLSVCDEKPHSVRCTVSAAESAFGGISVTVVYPAAGTYTVSARLATNTPDAKPENDTDTHTISVAGLPSLRAYGIADLPEGKAVDPGGPGRLRVGFQNDGETPSNVVLRALLTNGGHFTALEPYYTQSCTLSSETEVVCRFPGEWTTFASQFSFPFIAPDTPDGGTFPFSVSIDADQADFDPSDDTDGGTILLRDLIAVINANDEGPGSLRQAILDARTQCEDVPCLIGARGSEQLVIHPRSPLPELRGRVKVDGGAMKTILDGSRLPAGDGLRYEDGCEMRIDRMVIHNFPGHAIEAHQLAHPETTIPCGYDALLTPLFVTNSELIGNLRGVVTKGVSATITNNVIRDHKRAGIFADGANYTEIARNEILGNGASGIFVNPSLTGSSWLTPGADIFANIVRDNGEWGIARTPHGAVNITHNAVSGNNLYGIDYGLDLSTPNAPNKPVLISARYDPERNVTVIRGRITAATTGYSTDVELFASASLSRWGYPEAERFVKEVYSSADFEAEVPGDLRGQFITATGTRLVDLLFLRAEKVDANATSRYQTSDTSELSDALRVE